MNNYNYININKAFTRLKELASTKIEDKYIVVNSKNYLHIKKILEEMNIIVDLYSQPYCDTDKVYIIEKGVTW